MRALLAALVLLTAGCTLPEPAGPPGDAPTPGTAAPPEEPCATVTLEEGDRPAAVGAPATLVARVVSCSAKPLEVYVDGCGPAFTLTTQRGLHAWRLENGTAVVTPRSCRIDLWGPPALLLLPGEAHEERVAWNGTFHADPCGGCPRWAPAQGPHEVEADVIVAGRHFTARETVPWPKQAPADGPWPCPVDVRVEPRVVRPGEEARVTAALTNCGARDQSFDAHRCGLPHEVQALLGAWNATYPFPIRGAAPGVGIERACTSDVLPPRVVFPGASLTMTWAWNATWMDSGPEGVRFRDAQPGTYGVSVRARAYEGGDWAAEASVEVAPSS
ncbi:MAG TPA: hypothetical protein VNX21_00380 [Candidatus Thermoplasmatota archaeon]|nr:hypothetical protein [Candidatus Thermoplasmatota archaeon]